MTEIGTILAICVSERKGTRKARVPRCRIRAGHGIDGDAHAGPGHRQLSALADESIDRMRRVLPDLDPGAFGENLVTVGVDWRVFPVGSRLRLGRSALVEVTQHGKECHARCPIYYAAGECIMPREGVFLTAISDGDLLAGDAITAIPAPAEARGVSVGDTQRVRPTHGSDLREPDLGL